MKKMISLITFLSKIEVDWNCAGGEETTPQTLEDEDTTEVTVEVTEVNIRPTELKIRPTEANTRASEANAREPEASSETGRRKIFVARPRKLDISGISHSLQFKDLKNNKFSNFSLIFFKFFRHLVTHHPTNVRFIKLGYVSHHLSYASTHLQYLRHALLSYMQNRINLCLTPLSYINHPNISIRLTPLNYASPDHSYAN